MNWTKPPEPADFVVYIKHNKTNPEKSVIETNAGIFLPHIFKKWKRQADQRLKNGEVDTRRATVGNDYTLALYYYCDNRPIEMRSDVGNTDIETEYIGKTLSLILDGTITARRLMEA